MSYAGMLSSLLAFRRYLFELDPSGRSLQSGAAIWTGSGLHSQARRAGMRDQLRLIGEQ